MFRPDVTSTDLTCQVRPPEVLRPTAKRGRGPLPLRRTAVRAEEDTGHVLQVLVTPRSHRQKREAEGRDGSAAWRGREFTPVRALRKLRDKIKRSLNKAARGQHEAIVARGLT